ncbi:MAG: amidohydrolase family protein [Balneolales bacterium]
MRASITIFICISLFLFIYGCSSKSYSTDNNYDLLIENGTVIDGTGSAGVRSDVLIRDDQIIYIGDVNPSDIRVKRVLNAEGKVVTPGFIDTHAHGNPLRTPEFPNFLAMGVTTITLGQDGSSPSVGDTYNWMMDVKQAQPAVNIAHFVGHGSIRRKAGVDEKTDVSADEMQEMVDYVTEAMAAGSFGMTTGLEYLPGTYAGLNELTSLAEPVGRNNGLIMSHIRNEDDSNIEDSINELLEQGQNTDTPVHVSHIKIVYGNDVNRADDVLRIMQNARDKGQTVTADIYPYTASYTGIGIVFPDWAKAPNNYKQVVAERREELVEFLQNRVNRRNGPESTLFGTPPYAGKTLAEVSEEAGKPFEDVLIDDIGPTGASAAYFVMNEDVMARFLVDPKVMVASDGSPTMRHPRGYGTFARIIKEYVVDKEVLTLENAIHKMTGLPAVTLGMDKTRGFLKPNLAADILIFDPKKVVDHADFENPHILAEGFDYIIVNGGLAIDDGKITNTPFGMMLRK